MPRCLISGFYPKNVLKSDTKPSIQWAMRIWYIDGGVNKHGNVVLRWQHAVWLGFIVIRHILDFTAELVYEIGNDSPRHHVSSFKVNLFLPRLVVCRQPLFQPASQCCSLVSDQLCRATGHFILIFWLQPNYLVVVLSCLKFLARPPFLFRFNSFISA